ncbi:MAG: von Willebrand factor type A domain-containing protein, partial [Lachnospiraceae bacterium]|nr:von Willebrand factor type A domain-containing protein [Lachnospiraceae bacterium]
MKKMYVKRLLASVSAMAILTGSVTGCGMSMTATAPAAEAPATDAAYTAAAEETAPASDYSDEYEYVEEEAPAAAEEYEVFDSADLAAENSVAAYKSEAAQSYLDGAYDARSSARDSYKQGAEDTYLGSIYDYDEDDWDYDTDEEYADLDDQGYKSVRKAPLSTFAADVDTASYSNLRRLINDGYSVYDLPQNSVRIEELINYFDYDYREPKGSDPFSVNTVLSTCPWNGDALLLSLGLKTEDIDFSETPDSNLVFLIDVSGSMSDYDKLPLLQEAFCMLVDELSEKDRVSIVTYANGVDTVLSGEKGSNGRKIKKAINNLFAGGGTNGGKGIQTAYKLAEENFIKGGNN